jgi:hypothetical protein
MGFIWYLSYYTNCAKNKTQQMKLVDMSLVIKLLRYGFNDETYILSLIIKLKYEFGYET